jgi:methyltransferase (TIGR00027 family)
MWIGPSRTGQAVALMRAGMERPHTPDGDPDAQRRLCAGMTPTEVRHPGIAGRTRFVDEQVLAALRDGIDQIVICGAGYDDRALRFRSPATCYFELDHPLTQADKAAKLRAMGADLTGLVMAPADFADRNVAEVLARYGHDAARPTLFVCEGLLVYLDRETGDALLAELKERAAGGSRLVASLATHPAGVDSAYAVEVANARRRDASREPWLTILDRDTYLTAITATGWHVAQLVDAATLEPDAPPGRTLFAIAT